MTNAEARFNKSHIRKVSGYILTRMDRMGMSSVEMALLLVTSVTAAVM